MKIKIKELKTMINEAVKKKLFEQLDGNLNSSTMESETKPEIAVEKTKHEELNEIDYQKSTTWGEIPDPDELYELMGGKSFEMVLQGADSLAFDYAMDLSPDPRAGSTEPGEGMHATLVALVETIEPEELTDEQYEDVEKTLDQWFEKYDDKSIAEHAWSLAASIMQELGIEWI